MVPVETRTSGIVGRIASYGLDDDRSPGEVSPSNWPSFLERLSSEHLTGLATAATAAGALRLDAEQDEALSSAHFEAVVWSLALERLLITVTEALASERIQFVVLKGPAMAHCFYPDPSWRSFSDIDLLVPTGDWRRACRLLEDLGVRRDLPEPRRGFDERFGKAADHTNAEGLRVDLHRTLVLGPFGLWMKPDELFERVVPFKLAGLTLPRLEDTMIMLHACMHASLGWRPPLLMPLRDIVEIGRRGSVDWDELDRYAARWRLRAVLRHALATAREELGAAPPPAASALIDARVPRRERRALDSYVTSRRSRGGTMRATLWAVHGIRAKAVFLRDLLFPGHEFLAARTGQGERPSYVRRWTTPIRWLFRKP